MRLKNFSYTLPKSRIAQTPTKPRDACKLMALDLKKGSMKHTIFSQLPLLLKEGDVLVFNDSKVIPARLSARKETGGKAEILLIKKVSSNEWTALLKNVRHGDTGKTLIIANGFTCRIVKKNDDGAWLLHFSVSGKYLERNIQRYGATPLPPYITHPSKPQEYQTIYAKKSGSVAAPTAGLHFTKRLISNLKKHGVEMHYITLHVGPGTFLPIRTQVVEKHSMLAEYASVDVKTADAINRAKSQGKRIFAVGTTATRTLEAFATPTGTLKSGSKEVDLFIYPGYRFKIINGLITNFHLPSSTLLVLVCAFAEWKKRGGIQTILHAYRTAVRKKYRFYSFGDAMMIV